MSILLGFLWYQVIAIFGLSIGLHRYFSHKQFQTSKIYEIIVLLLVTLTGARSPLTWIGTHRMHHAHADTDKDPHSPDHVGFWNVLFNNWKVKKIERPYVRDLYKNPRVMFFHKYWKYIHLSMAVIVSLIGIDYFIAIIVVPYVLGFFGYGFFNAGGHKNYNPRTNLWINLLSAGEGFHDVHHRNPTQTRLNKYDISGFIIERLFNEKETGTSQFSKSKIKG
mgnify:CR=1 FL=1